MILTSKYEPAILIENLHWQSCRLQDELVKIYEFIDLPDHIRIIEQQNSTILRAYYANALSHNIVDIKTVKYIVTGNIKPKGINERAVEHYVKAEQYLNSVIHEPLSIQMLYQLQKILILDLYNNREDINLFSTNSTRVPERLSPTAEMELESLFAFMNHDDEFPPIIQSWILHFRLLNIRLFSECTTKIASLLQHFWLKKKGMDVFGLLSLEHELYANKHEYQNYTDDQLPDYISDQQQQFDFGMELYGMQLERLKQLLRSYFRKQVDFEKLNPRQKNIMNYVFERGYRLKEIDDSVLNKRQKLIMYIIQNRGFISTKELVSEFECNRKTIQRDFTELTEQNLVKVIGKGAGLRYAVNLTERKHEGLAKYQSEWVVDDPVEMEEE
ncbi:MAG: DeoR family transcriptional regulator [Bacteroidota bacterium]